MVFKKKEIIAASLVLLIGMAGYLNWSYQDTVRVTDGESYIETGKKLGEAQFVSDVASDVEDTSETTTEDEVDEKSENTVSVETVTDNGGYFDQVKINRETARSKAVEILNNTAENTNFDEETRKKAADKVVETSENITRENAMESLAIAKGYSEICVHMEDGTANIMVRKADFNDNDVLVLTEMATQTLKISANNIKIVEVR